MKLGVNFIGFEIDPYYANMANNSVLSQKSLYAVTASKNQGILII